MATMLTTRDIQELINVDRSTIYRMAETGTLPAIKVGRQWRFPADEIQTWLRTQTKEPPSAAPDLAADARELDALVPSQVTQAIADLVADLLDTMLIVADMDGRPLTRVSHPCGLYGAVADEPGVADICARTWNRLGADLEFEPNYVESPFGFLCARSFIRIGTELKGMVIAGGIATEDWPAGTDTAGIAAGLELDPELIESHINGVYVKDLAQRQAILSVLPRLARVISLVARTQGRLVDRFEAIATLIEPVLSARSNA